MVEADISSRVVIDFTALLIVTTVSVITLVLGVMGLGKRSHRARAGFAVGIAVYANLNAVFSFAGTFITG